MKQLILSFALLLFISFLIPIKSINAQQQEAIKQQADARLEFYSRSGEDKN